METSLLMGLRNLLAVGILLSACSLQPEISFAVVRPLVSLWLRLKLFHTSVAARFRSSGKERFWEIDMTKFEP